MKKFLLLVLFLFTITQGWTQPFCYASLLPNQAFRGQTLTTTITNNNLFMGYGSAPCNPSDIRLNQSSTSTTIYASTLSVINDSIYVGWNIPANAPNGGYDLIMDQYNYDPINGNCFLGPSICQVNQAFGIGASIVSGMTYFDSNLDSIFNGGDLPIRNLRVILLPDSIFTFSNYNGIYQFFADTGAHTIVVDSNGYYIPYSSDTLPVQLAQTNSTGNDFAFSQSAAAFNTDVWISGRARCNTVQTYYHYYNNHSLTPVDILFKIYYSGNVIFQNAPVAPDSVVGDTLYYGLQNVTLASGHISVNFLIPSAGSSITFNVITQTFNQSGNLVSTNSNKLSQNVTCSYDPNDKAVNPVGDGPDHYTLFNEKLYYHIRFQNTGTDTAYYVHIIDTIDSNLDFSSFELLSSSHPVTVVATFDGIVDFRFYNIMLPDSFVDEPASNGYVSYAIMSKQGLPEKTDVYNRAHIYFDANAPVATNQTQNSMVTSIPVGIKTLAGDRNFVLYPNPFSERITLVNITQATFDCILSIYDSQGRLLRTDRLTSENSVLNTHGLSAGMYVYKLMNKDGSIVHFGRMIKQ